MHDIVYCNGPRCCELPDDSGEVPKSNKVVGGSIPSREFVFPFVEKTSQVVKCLLCSPKRKEKKNDIAYCNVSCLYMH
jgi:hypothetical protein